MTPQPRQTDEISQTLPRIKADALALACVLIGGGGVLVMTIWLVIKDGSQAATGWAVGRIYNGVDNVRER